MSENIFSSISTERGFPSSKVMAGLKYISQEFRYVLEQTQPLTTRHIWLEWVLYVREILLLKLFIAYF